MDTVEQIELIKLAIEKADRFESKLSDDAIRVPMLGSLKIRALLNNLGAISKHALDVGVHKGGSSCSIVHGNPLLTFTAVDSFASDEDPVNANDKAEPQFLANVTRFLHPDTQLTIIKGDAFEVADHLEQIHHKFDLYAYDAGHSEKDQEMALTYYLPFMADEFIYCCDDFDFEQVRPGTRRGLELSGVDILFERELLMGDIEYNNDHWWRGYYVTLLKKKS